MNPSIAILPAVYTATSGIGARNLLRREDFAVAEVAERDGYGSASTFSTAFSRHVGQPPSRYARRARG